MRFVAGIFMVMAFSAAGVSAATLDVGDGLAITRIEDAVAKAKEGDEIVVHPKAGGAAYDHVALLIKTAKLNIHATGKDLIKIDGTGFDYSGRGSIPRAIVQFDPSANGCTLEGFDLSGARNESFNGAGVRINQANDVTIRRCKIHDNDMGIMSNGSVSANSASNQLIEGCTITDNGSDKDPGYNHNLYLGGTSVTVRACEIARSVTGHNLKSRAHLNWIEYNYIHDSANRELDLVDEKGNTDAPGSNTILLGNIIVKKLANMSGNKATIHFGQDGGHDHTGTLYLVHNTIVTPYISPVVDLDAPGIAVAFINNLISDHNAGQAGVLVSLHKGAAIEKVTGEGNNIAAAFRASLPASIHSGDIVPWAKIDLPWPDAHRPQLQEYTSVGVLTPRTIFDSGAGTFATPLLKN